MSEPLLIDRVRHELNDTILTGESLSSITLRARRFVLDHDFLRALAQLVTEGSSLIARDHDFALPPYETCWIEFDARFFYGLIDPGGVNSHSDDRIGFLFNGMVVYPFGHSKAFKNVLGWPMIYRLHRPWVDDQEFRARVKLTEAQLDTYLWGSSIRHLTPAEIASMRSHHTIEAFRLEDVNDLPHFKELLYSASGELRIVLAILLLLNRPKATTQAVGARRGWLRSKPKPFMSYNLVSIDINEVTAMSKPSLTGITKRAHEVRTHMAQTRSTCHHTWRQIDDRRWLCDCGAKRWVRQAHVRGDASKGFVNKTYGVTA